MLEAVEVSEGDFLKIGREYAIIKQKQRNHVMLRRFLCSITVFLLTVSIGFAQVVPIPDANLQRALQEELGITPPFTQQNMMRLTQLHAIEKGIADIQGLEFAVHLMSPSTSWTWLPLQMLLTTETSRTKDSA